MSKADEIRKLLGEGKSRSEAARIAGTTYQQVYQVDKKRAGYVKPPARAAGGVRSSGGWHDQGYSPYVPAKPVFEDRKLPVRGHGAHPIRTGPIQVRIATQDGHQVRLTDDLGGKVCLNCKRPLGYSIRVLAYVHEGSQAPVTATEDMQQGPGLFDSPNLTA